MMKELSRQIQAVVPGSPHTAGVCVLLGEGEGLDPSNHATCSWVHKSCEIWENDDKMKVASETNLSDSAAPWVWCWKRHYVLFNLPAPLSMHVRILQVTVGVLHHPRLIQPNLNTSQAHDFHLETISQLHFPDIVWNSWRKTLIYINHHVLKRPAFYLLKIFYLCF